MMSDLFGGLIKRGDGARHAAERELHRRVERWGQSQFPYRGPADFILRHGRYFAPRELPDRYAHLTGPPQACFVNALHAAQADESLTYVEGVYVVTSNATAHAWCIDPEGKVVELTLPTDTATLSRAKFPHRRYDEGMTVGEANGLISAPLADQWAYYGVEFPNVDFVAECFDRHQLASLIDLPERGYPLLQQPWTPLMRRLP
jgi:hypothetical protein